MNATKSVVAHARNVPTADEPAWPRWREGLSRSVADAIVEQVFAERAASPSFRERITCFVREHMTAAGVVGRPAGQARRTVEEQAADFGEWLAEQQIAADVVQQVYWAGMRHTLESWAEAGWPGPASAAPQSGPTPGERVTQVTRRAMEVTERSTAAAKAAHARITAELRRGGVLGRRALAMEIVEGAHDTVTLGLETTLGYRLSATHLALVLDMSSREAAERALRQVAAAVGARDRLLVPMAAPQWAGWLGFTRDPGPRGPAALRQALRAAGLSASLGGARYGIHGFRRSFKEACRVEEMRPVLAPEADQVLAFTELALESVLLSDVDAAGAFAVDELGELAARTARAARLRQTLAVWLSCGSQTLTAARLGIHENTVRLRIATATRTLGPGLLDRRTELLIALRLCRVVGADSLPTPESPSPTPIGAAADRRRSAQDRGRGRNGSRGSAPIAG